ncbi:MAG: hypothetical protein ACLTW9_04230 [Enterocloster sp.]
MEFEENGLIREDFGNLQGKVWRNNVILTTTNIKVEAIGSCKKIRGRKHRNWSGPDLLVLDDIENDENVRTAESSVSKLSTGLTRPSVRQATVIRISCIGTLLYP